jgi:hypothetical protein
MNSIFVSLLLAAAPAPAPALGEISTPLGHIGNVVDALPKGGVSDSDKLLAPKWEGCDAKGIYLMRFMGGAGRALEQLQQSLDRAAGSEKKLFGRKGVLTEVMKLLSASRFELKESCPAAPLADGFKLELTAPPKKWCDAKLDATEGEFWFFSGKSPAAVISVQKGGTDVCKPRLSTVLFDAKGMGRVRLHADWGGAISATLVGEKCQLVDYTLDVDKQVFVPVWKSCKR